MGTTLRFKVGLALALLGLFTLTLTAPSSAFAQDDEPDTVDAAQTSDEQAEEPPADENADQPATDDSSDASSDDSSEPPADDTSSEPPAEEEPAPPADTTAPSINQPGDVSAAADDASGATVEFGRPDASDETDGSVGVDCNPGSGSLFPLGTTTVTCSATDAAGNYAEVSFAIVVTDQTAPSIDGAGDVVAEAPDAEGTTVEFNGPSASDNVDGGVAVTYDPVSGSFFPVGTTTVTCWAQDSAGNTADSVSFSVTVNAAPEPTPTTEPTQEPTQKPTQEPTAEPTETAIPTEQPAEEPTQSPTDSPTDEPTKSPTESPTDVPTDPTKTPEKPTPVTNPTPTATPKADGETSEPRPGPTPEALPFDESLLNSFVIVTDGGPLGVLTSIWGNLDFPISQEFGHTDFSVTHHIWYAYGADYGLDGYEHPGIDIGMPAGTPLYSPVEGVVKISGNTPYYTFYGNGKPNVGELLIETKDGNQVVLGHMGRIAVNVGDKVKIGQFVGLSGGDNGDHLHLETREVQPLGGFKIVDPRKSFLVDVLEGAARKAAKKAVGTSDDDGFESLSRPAGRVAAVGGETSDKYARITIRRVNCEVDESGNAVAACADNVLSGSSFTVYNPTNHGKTRVTDPTGLVSFAPRAGDNVIEKSGDGEFNGAYVSCVAENTGRVLFEGAVSDPSVAIHTEAGDQVMCSWYNLAD